MFQWWEGLIAGGAATLVMTVLMQMGAAMGMTRMSMTEMLGSMFVRDATAARRLGSAVHFMNGLAFGVLYAAVWWALEPAIESAWWVGLIFGAVHGFVAMAAMPMMSAMHPRVRETAPQGEVVLPRFGFGGTGFGAMTPMGIMMGHLVFGVVWGLVFWWLA